jgi:hypothetical protein
MIENIESWELLNPLSYMLTDSARLFRPTWPRQRDGLYWDDKEGWNRMIPKLAAVLKSPPRVLPTHLSEFWQTTVRYEHSYCVVSVSDLRSQVNYLSQVFSTQRSHTSSSVTSGDKAKTCKVLDKFNKIGTIADSQTFANSVLRNGAVHL